jgi:nucleoside-diphosphate-sugar epimerase
MRVLVAGASGVVGRRLVPLLVEAGHEVIGMTSTPERVDALRAARAEPVVCDALDGAAVREAVVAASPEVVVHALTRVPAKLHPRRMPREFETTDRLRAEGARHLVDAARAAGARRVVAHAIAFAYRQDAPGLSSEDEPIWLDAPKQFRRTARSLAELERHVTTAEGLEGVVLRNGHYYGPGTHVGRDGSMAAAVRARRLPIVGDGGGTFSFVHVEDVARATAQAVDGGAPGIYNVVDDDPAPVREWLPYYAETLGAPPPRRVPRIAALVATGGWGLAFMTTQRGASNDRAKADLGWQPRWTSWRTGFREANG